MRKPFVPAIEKDIPPPPPRIQNVYPFWSMEVGESFFVPAESPLMVGALRRAVNMAIHRFHAAAAKEGKKTDRLFKASSALKDGECGVRCWRIK